ncbi:DEAD/DEAH box helicase [Simkania sp.]|uniref:DEAD/DEAH box helicase n=1 Tax=Simkania sp. TaxID=34094 RepID=UPI003B527EF5
MTFNNLCLHPKILKAVDKVGYPKPTQIQEKAIPKIIRGFDIRASAQTGTGKTAAFLLPALNRLLSPAEKTGIGPRVLILAPTRELAQQIATQTSKYSKSLQKIKTVCIVGGVPYPPQMRQLSRPHEILIATPGRLIDFMERDKIDFSRLEMLVLDEADRMLDMGFSKPVEQIVKATPSTRQTLLFSATLQGEVIKLSDRLLSKPMEIIVRPEEKKKQNIQQALHFADDLKHKNRLLDHVLNQEETGYTIVFTSTKRHADQLARDLRDKQHPVAALHGDMNQNKRSRTLTQLRKGKIRILVATDVAARGIDVESITHVINYDLPTNVEDYVHRIGRTGRAGAKGQALSFVSDRDSGMMKKIQEFTGQKVDVVEFTGLEATVKKRSHLRQHRQKKRAKRKENPFQKAKKENFRKRKFRNRKSNG